MAALDRFYYIPNDFTCLKNINKNTNLPLSNGDTLLQIVRPIIMKMPIPVADKSAMPPTTAPINVPSSIVLSDSELDCLDAS